MKPKDAVNKISLFLLLFSFAGGLLFGKEHKEKFVLDSLSNRDRKPILTPFQPEEKKIPPKLEAAPKPEVIVRPKPKPKPKQETPPIKTPDATSTYVAPLPPEPEIFLETEQLEKKKPYAIIGLIMSGTVSAILILLVIIHIIKKESSYQRRKVLGYAKEKNRIEEDVRSLQETSRGLEREIEKRIPREFADSIKSGRMSTEIAEVISAAIEPRTREMVVAYQGIKKTLTELDREVEQLQAIKNISFKDLARQAASEFWRPLQNEFNKTRLSYEKLFSEFEEREDGRLSSLDKRYGKVEMALAEVSRRLVALDSVVTSTTSFAGEPIIRTPKPEAEEEEKRDRTSINNLLYKLADQGLTIDEIAQKTKIGKGEIKLILDVRAKRE
ncbi:MAG: hypothetical protein QME07_07150 [bacterium]|nr:hypothetical protein [bacterium]